MFESLFKAFSCIIRKEDEESVTWAEGSRHKAENVTDKRKYLVIDLDETLVHSRDSSFSGCDRTMTIQVEKRRKRFYLATRPYLFEFLEEMSKHYTLILFTASARGYAEPVINTLGIAKHFQRMLFRDDCTSTWHGTTKDLMVLGLPLKNVVLVDDSLENSYYQPENICLIHPFEGDKTDTVLRDLIPFLKDLATHADVREVDPKYVKYLSQLEEAEKSRHKKTLSVPPVVTRQKIDLLEEYALTARKTSSTERPEPDTADTIRIEKIDSNNSVNSPTTCKVSFALSAANEIIS